MFRKELYENDAECIKNINKNKKVHFEEDSVQNALDFLVNLDSRIRYNKVA